MPPTEKVDFCCTKNPRVALKEKNLRDRAVWFAFYDDDLLEASFMSKVSYCKLKIQPQKQANFEIRDMEVCLGSRRGVYIRKSEESHVMARAYLI